MVRGRSVLARPVGECLLAPVHASGRPERRRILAASAPPLSEPSWASSSTRTTSSRTNCCSLIPSNCSGLGSGGVYIGVGPEQNFSFIARLRAGTGVPHRHPPGESASAPDLQGAVRRVRRPCGFCVPTLLARAAGRARSRVFQWTISSVLMRRGCRLRAALRRQRRHGSYMNGSSGTRAASHSRVTISRRSTESWQSVPRRRSGHPLRSIAAADGGRSFVSCADDRQGRARPEPQLSCDGGGRFSFVKDLHARNLIVPVVGDFSGPTAVRRVGDYIRERGKFRLRVLWLERAGDI